MNDKNPREMRRRRKRIRAIKSFCIILILFALTAVFACLIILMVNKKRTPEYTYVSLTAEASAKAYVWLNQIDDINLSYEDIRTLMGELNLKFESKYDTKTKTYTKALVPESYSACKNRSKNVLEQAYRNVLKVRIEESGYDGEITDETLDEIMQEAYGMTIHEYLEYCNIDLIPSIEEVERKLYWQNIYP